jgi:hypothetical protein
MEAWRCDYSLDKKRRNAKFAIYPENGINHFFEYERALDVLTRCALDLEKRGGNRSRTLDTQNENGGSSGNS